MGLCSDWSSTACRGKHWCDKLRRGTGLRAGMVQARNAMARMVGAWNASAWCGELSSGTHGLCQVRRGTCHLAGKVGIRRGVVGRCGEMWEKAVPCSAWNGLVRCASVRNGPKGRYGLVTVGCDGVWPGAPWIGLVGLVFGMVRFGKLRMGLAGWASASSGSVWKALVRHASTHWN